MIGEGSGDLNWTKFHCITSSREVAGEEDRRWRQRKQGHTHALGTLKSAAKEADESAESESVRLSRD